MPDIDLIQKSHQAVKFTLIFKTLSQVLGGCATILLVRALSEKEYGIYHLLYSIIPLIGLTTSLGLANTLQRFIPEYYKKNKFQMAHVLYRTASFLRLVCNILFMGLFLLFWEQIAPVLKLIEYKPYVMLFTIVIFLDMQRPLLDICLSSFFLQQYAKPIGCLFPMIKVIGYSYVIFSGKNIWYAILTDLLAYIIVVTVLQIIYFKKIPNQKPQQKFPEKEKKRLFRYAVFYNFNDTGDGLLNSYFDNFIIVLFLNPIAVGAYSFFITLTVFISRILPIGYFMEIIRPAFFSAGTSKFFYGSTLFFQNTIKVNSIFTIPTFFFLLIYTSDFVQILFEGKFIEFAYVLPAVFFFFEVLNFPSSLIAQLREKANIILFSKIFALYNLAMDLILIKWFGIWGAVFATGTAVLGKNLFIWFFVRKDATFKGMGLFFIKIIFFWISISIILGQLNSFIPCEWGRIAFGILSFTGAFILQFRCRFFNEKEKNFWQNLSNGQPMTTRLLSYAGMLPKNLGNH